MKLVVFHPDADAEITEAARYYELHKPGLGSDFLAEVERGLDQISTNPEAAQRIARRARRKSLPSRAGDDDEKIFSRRASEPAGF